MTVTTGATTGSSTTGWPTEGSTAIFDLAEGLFEDDGDQVAACGRSPAA